MNRPKAPNRHPAADPACERCTGLGIRILGRGYFADAETCDCVGTCSICHGTGFVEVGSGFRAPKRRCVCAVFENRVRLLKEARIPARYADATLSNFDSTERGRMAAFRAVNAYVQRFEPGEPNRGFVLHGAVGRGKTHLLVAVMRDLIIRYGISARFVEFSHLLGDLKASFDRGHGSADILAPLSRVEILAIDELGKGRNTQFESTVVDELISRRYNAGSAVLATTNFGPGSATGVTAANLAAVGSSQTPTLADRVGERVYSRLREMNDFIPLVGDDFRERLRSR